MAANEPNQGVEASRREGSEPLAPDALADRLLEEIGRAERHGTDLSCLLVVIDNLEEIAREHGRNLPEETLTYVARTLRGELRRFDRVGRPNREELAIVLPGADGPRREIVARRILERLQTIKVEAAGERLALQISVGLAAWRPQMSGEDLLEPRARRSAAGPTASRPRRTLRRDRAGASAPDETSSARRCAQRDACICRSPRLHNPLVLSGSELWLLRLMADRGLALLDASTLLVVIEERGELRVAAASGAGSVRAADRARAGERARRASIRRASRCRSTARGASEAAWLHELGLEARAALVEPLSMEGQGSGLVIALRRDSGFRDPDREALSAFATSVAQRLAAERSVEIERLRYGMEARERERTRWAREIHDESIQGIGALRLQLANARDLDDGQALAAAVDTVLEGLGTEIDGLRHLITELRPAALDDLGLAAALEALARRAQAIDGLEVQTEIELARCPRGARRGGRDGAGHRLDPELESTIYRVVQEALTNVSRHAEATAAVVSVVARDGVVRASCTDDGKGLPDAERLGPRGDGLEGGFGMGGMRERAELVGGELEFRPAPGGGTTVELTVPLAGRPAAAGRAAAALAERLLQRGRASRRGPCAARRR